VTLVREHGRKGVWLWVKDTDLLTFNVLPIPPSSDDYEGTARPEVWYEERPGSANESDHEAPGGLAVEIKHGDSGSARSQNQTLVSEELKVEAD